MLTIDTLIAALTTLRQRTGGDMAIGLPDLEYGTYYAFDDVTIRQAAALAPGDEPDDPRLGARFVALN